MQAQNIQRKFDKCPHYNSPLSEEHRHHINAPEYGNCVLCLSEWEGPMTQDKISQYLGLSKMRICQIEKQAVKKMKKRMIKLVD